MGTLYTRLSSITGEMSPESIEHHIARVMLEHIHQLNNISIGAMADLCSVSKSTISKFVKQLGFEDYKTSFDMEYKDLLKKLADHIKQAVDQQVTIDAYLLQEQLEILEEWKRNFIERLPNKTMKSYIERLFKLCD